MARKPMDFTAAPIRGRFEAWVLDATDLLVRREHGDRKEQSIGSLDGTVLEIGPGSGANMRYYRPGVKVIGIEPNPAMHPRLRAKADEHGVDLEIRTLRGEELDVADDSVDHVVATLLLCGVDDPEQVLGEVRRVLKPGGTYFFLEHVAAPDGTLTRRLQRWVLRPHRWLFNGCEVDRDTGSLLERAGFADIDIEPVDLGPVGGYLRHQIVGVARN